MNTRAPVAFFIFNRPDVTARVARAIAAARPSQVLVVADGPRTDREGEVQRCEQARAMVAGIEWPCEVVTHYAEANLGCKRRIASGLDWVFSRVPEAIILEDDCLPEPSFFRFCDEMLERYRDDARVHMVRGCNLLFGERFTWESYYFSRFYNIWGWASWARAWQGYDVDLKQWPALRDSGWLEHTVPERDLARLVRHFLDQTHAGRINTWDYQWLLLGWLHQRLAIVPEVNLVTNLGHGAGATHTRSRTDHLAELPTQPLSFPLRHPHKVEALRTADEREWNSVYPARARRNWFWQQLRHRVFAFGQRR